MSKHKDDSKIVAHTRRELELAGAFKKDENSDGSLGRGLLSMVKAFSDWAEGDGAKMETLAMGFQQVIAGELLSPPTTNPDEWEPVEGAEPGTMRNRRCPFYVTTDSGKTWMHLQNKQRGNSRNHITGEDVEDEPSETTPVSTTGEGSPTDDQGSSEDPAAQNRSRLDAGVEAESQKMPGIPENGAKKPKAGEA